MDILETKISTKVEMVVEDKSKNLYQVMVTGAGMTPRQHVTELAAKLAEDLRDI